MEKEPLLQTPVKRAAKWDAATWDAALRVGCLLLLVVQNSSIILVTSYSRTLQPPYLPTVAVFLAEARRQPYLLPGVAGYSCALHGRPNHATSPLCRCKRWWRRSLCWPGSSGQR